MLHKGWTPAWKLTPDDLLISADGQYVPVSGLRHTEDWETVYNLRVADWHTYFVGTEAWGFSVWVHNAYFVRRIEGTNSWTLVNEAGEIAPVAAGKKWGNPRDVEKFAESHSIESVVRDTKTTWQPPEAPVAANASVKLTMVNPDELTPTHFTGKHNATEMEALKQSIRDKGFLFNPDEPVAYVISGGKKYIVDGHHRVRAAREVGLKDIPTVEVKLPYKGYRTEADLAFDYGPFSGP